MVFVQMSRQPLKQDLFVILKKTRIAGYLVTALPLAPSKEQKVTHTYTQPGSYLVTLSQTNECTTMVTKDTVVIYETPPAMNLRADIDTCGQYINLDMGITAQIYEWYNRGRIVGRSKTLKVTATGRYIAVAYNGPQRDCFTADTTEVTLRKPPAFDLGADTTMCRDSSILITAPGLTWREFLWSTGETTRDITVRQPGTYFVQVKNGNDCYNADTIQVGELPSPILGLAPEYYICIPDGGSTVLDAKGVGVVHYEWPATGDTTQTITVNQKGVYTVLGTNKEGCVAKKSTTVFDQCEPRFFIPDAFTPDGNGKNETLEVFGAYYINYSIRIYNRWGEVIYATQFDRKPLGWNLQRNESTAWSLSIYCVLRSSIFPRTESCCIAWLRYGDPLNVRFCQ